MRLLLHRVLMKVLAASQSDAMIRDVFGGGVQYGNTEKLGYGSMTEVEFRKLFSTDSSFLYEPLFDMFKEQWPLVHMAHSQNPAYVMPKIIKFAVHNDGKRESISIDLPDDADISSQIVPRNAKDEDTIVCRYITTVARMKISDTMVTDRETNKKKIIGYLDGPIQSVHVLREIEEDNQGVKSKVWRYQLESISSKNPQLIAMFEGRMFSQMELPAYADYMRKKYDDLNEACDTYLHDLLKSFCIKLTGSIDSSQAAATKQEDTDSIFYGFEYVKDVIRAIAGRKGQSILENEVAILESFIKHLNENIDQDSIKNQIKRYSPDLDVTIKIIKHAALMMELKAKLHDDKKPMPHRIDDVETLLNKNRFLLREHPLASTKVFAEKADKAIEKPFTEGTLKAINQALQEKPGLFARIFTASSSTSSSSKPTQGPKK